MTALADLFASLRDDPDDHDRYLVYADALQSAGDLHGELIALQTARATTPELVAREREVRGVFEAELIGARGNGVRLAWRNGFVTRVEIRGAADEILAERWLATHRCLGLVREVMFDHRPEETRGHAESAVEALVTALGAATIERVSIGNRLRPAPSEDLLARLTEELPRLRALELGASSPPALSPLRTITELAFWGGTAFTPAWLAGLTALPLRSLVLGFGRPRAWDEVRGVLDGVDALALDQLGLMLSGQDARLVDELPTRHVWSGLRSIGLSWGDLPRAGEVRLAANKAAFADKALVWPMPLGVAIPPEPAFLLGALLRLRLQRPADALPLYERAATVEPDLAVRWFGLGNVYSQLERRADAVRAWDRAIELEPNHASALYNRGRALVALGRFAEATASLSRATEANRQHVNAWHELGNLHRRLGRVDEAIACFTAATEIDPKHHAARDVFDTLLEHGRAEAALAHITELVARQPGDAQLARKHGRALLALRRPAEALAIADRACEAAPDDYWNQYLRLASLRELGRTGDALAVCDRLADKPAALLQAALLANRTDVRLPADSATEQAAAATAALFAICEAALRGDLVDAARLTSILASGEPGFALDRRWDITDTIECVARARPEHAALVTECYAAATGRSAHVE